MKAEPPQGVPIPEQIVEDESPEEVPTPEQMVGAETGMVPTAGSIVEADPPEEVPIPEQIGEAEPGLVGEVPISESITKAEPSEEVLIPERNVEAETGSVKGVPISGPTVKPGLPKDSTTTDQVYSHEGGELSAEDFEQELAVIPEIVISMTDEVSIDDIKSFLGSLNYYRRFLEDYAVYASTLYELREVDFAELKVRADLREIWNGMEDEHADCNTSGGIASKIDPGVKEERWMHAFRAFWTLREK
ncbi:hypothetical protein PF011_g30486, partial [Phytophthora fragariae]